MKCNSSALKLGRCTVCAIDLGHVIYVYIPYYRKLTLHEIKVLEINTNLMAKDFRILKINTKEEVEFHNKGN